MAPSFAIPKFRSRLGLTQAILYFITIIFGFCVAIPVGIELRRFDGKCVLFSQIVWEGSMIYPWREESCSFVLAFSVGVCIVYATMLGAFTMHAVWPKHSTGNMEDEHKVGLVEHHNAEYALRGYNPVFTIVNTVVAMLSLAMAAVISAGLTSFCNTIMDELESQGTPIKSCVDAQKLDWTRVNIIGGRDTGVRGQGFQIAFGIAALASWILVVLWTIQLLLNLSICCVGCSCELSGEKVKDDKVTRVARSRHSRAMTPSQGGGGAVPIAQQPVFSGQASTEA